MGDSTPLKCQKIGEIENNVDEIDHISSLGDGLLSHILSFLTTKQAVKTSVLSKRWKNVWLGTPVIDFYEEPSEVITKNDRFASFVSRVLSINSFSRLKKFRFSHLFSADHVHVNAWITNLRERSIEDVELDFDPTSLLRHQALTQLLFMFLTQVQPVHLKIVSGPIKEFPVLTAQFSHLKILRLWDVSFECPTSMSRLLASCPVLEELHANWCRWHNVHIESSTLKYLALKLGSSQTNHPSMLINAPSLQQIYLKCFRQNCPETYSPMPYILKADICSVDVSLPLLQAVTDTKTMRLVCNHTISETVKTAVHTNQLFFNYLTCLKLSVRGGGLQFLLGMLKSSPNLASLVFFKPYSCSCERLMFDLHLPESIKWIPPPDVPKCLLSSLESIDIKFGSYKDYSCENCLGMVGYFIRNGAAVKEMKLSASNEIDTAKEKVIKHLNELLLLPKASTACKIGFVCKEEEVDQYQTKELLLLPLPKASTACPIGFICNDGEVDQYQVDL